MRVASVLRFLAVLATPGIALIVTAVAIQRPDPDLKTSVFTEPQRRQQIEPIVRQLSELLQKKEYRQATMTARRILALLPDEPESHLLVARCLCLQGDIERAVVVLKQAISLGWSDTRRMEQDPAFEAIRQRDDYPALLEQVKADNTKPRGRKVEPAKVSGGVVMVDEQNARWDPTRNCILVDLESPMPNPEVAVIKGTTEADQEVIKWYAEGTAAGHWGDFYDNRDRDHSDLNLSRFPQLTRIEYSDSAKKTSIDNGVQIFLAYNRPVIGNSSTALVGSPFWRSNPRTFLTKDGFTKIVYNQYVNNMMYFYPEHNDYDPEHGDAYPANTPFYVVSQGSSGSDQPFLNAYALTMAALRPEVKEKVVRAGLLPALLQMIFRRSSKLVKTEEDYLSGVAHPPVFVANRIDELRLVRLAHEITEPEIPPMVQLQVVEEDGAISGRDFFFPALNEALFDTPAAIARIHRTVESRRRMVVDASSTGSFNGTRPRFHWAVLQGPAEQVQIRPLNADQSRVEIIFPWVPQVDVPIRSEISSSRIDVGVFASTGKYWSAPGFVTSYCLRKEKRSYDEQGRVLSVDYGDAKARKRYDDPLIDVEKSWKDTYQYSEDGQKTGWVRTGAGPKPIEFHSDGTAILKRDPLGRCAESVEVEYRVITSDNEPPRLEQILSTSRIQWTYSSETDRQGTGTRVP